MILDIWGLMATRLATLGSQHRFKFFTFSTILGLVSTLIPGFSHTASISRIDVVADALSQETRSKSGVPQGLVIGALLF